jgi:integrase
MSLTEFRNSCGQSKAKVLRTLRRIGHGSDQMTAHGFRTSACTLLNEQGWHQALIGLQLAHKERNSVRAAYNRRLNGRLRAWHSDRRQEAPTAASNGDCF